MTATGRRRPRAPRSTGLNQAAFGQRVRPYAPVRVISLDQVEAIHQAALRVLSVIGIRVLDPTARSLYAQAGATIIEDRVRLDPAMIEGLLKTVPESFTLSARNPIHDVVVGGDVCVYTSVGGPAYVMDNDRGRRDGTFAEMCDFMRLVQSLNVLHQEGGGPFEPMDLPANTRHLDIYRAQITLVDKTWQGQTLGRARTMDGIELAALSLGTTPDGLKDRPVLVGVINTNSPLQLDIPMAEGLIAMAEHGQPVAITPFTLAGAMAPVTIGGALTQQHAEAMAVIALTQIVRPGAPVLYGGFTSNVDMRTGSPAFGTPEYMKAAQASGQLARRIGVPFRSSNVTAANDVDAQAAYESQMALFGALMGGCHLLEHGAGWMHGGLTASFEKLILDAELLQMMDAYFEPIRTDADSLALDAIEEAGPGGHFFGTAHTMDRYGKAFHTPLLSNWDNYPTWLDKGGIDARTRAHQVWTALLKDYEQPPLDPGIAEAIDAYVARRKEEGGAPMN
ncbi:trimethylamine methyltransferase family protein [Rhodospirillaceae bacterium KN72]|uniref:Methyltransferase n=1 Tax=Pacificispira spongiicola TaxID=2729598 RepID=A0A7Y0HFJ7_9PROT|nr:trimethylamine methyltransferase family protein [Pacificispira spongiicola]NMM43344.1 trimethylamine methyltransferase family protein [Pacificispira spongiicola]